jgi:predicted nuclease of predicted toxin-antitoxin system
MKLLFDENLSPKLPNRLSDLFPNSLHVRDVGMNATVDVPLYLENSVKKIAHCT